MINAKTVKNALYIAAIFNWSSAVMLFFYRSVVPVEFLPIPTHSQWIIMLSALIGSFGFAYFWAARDLLANIPLLKLGVVGKAFVFAAIVYVFKSEGDTLSQINLFFGFVDMAWGVFFLYVIFNADRITAAA